MARRLVSSWNGTCMRKRSAKGKVIFFLLGIVLAGGYAAYTIRAKLEPLPKGKAQLVRVEKKSPTSTILSQLEDKGIIRSAAATGFYARYKKWPASIEDGTYRLSPGMTSDELIKALNSPVTVKVTVPEYYWISRTAELMGKKDVATEQEFKALAHKPSEFAKEVDFPLPKTSLEGYLFPDTYQIEPEIGARSVIKQQLENFQKRVWEGLKQPKNLQRAVIIASIVEREAKLDKERPMVAGVIENRLAKGMPLEMDATILYAQQDWHIPTPADIRQTVSPYNTYKNKGLPPGPICSPGLKSIEAALKPSRHNYYFYVALPDGKSLFATTLAEHNANINKRRAALRAMKR